MTIVNIIVFYFAIFFANVASMGHRLHLRLSFRNRFDDFEARRSTYHVVYGGPSAIYSDLYHAVSFEHLRKPFR